MRNILSALTEVRALQLKRSNREQAIVPMVEMFRYLDGQLNGIRNTRDVPDTETLGEVMTSADFTYAIQEFVQRMMIPGYDTKRFAFEPLVWADTLPNFLNVTRYQRRASVDDLEYLGEKGTPRPGSVADATKRRYRIRRWAKQFEFSMETLVNDDLGYLEDASRDIGMAARRTLEKFVSRLYTNATSIGRLNGLGALYGITGRLNSTRVSTAHMAFNQRVDATGNPMPIQLRYIVHHSGLVDQVRVIRASELIPELATNAANVIAGDFVPIEDPYIVGVAPNLPWWAFSDWRVGNVRPLVLARRAGVPAPMLIRKRSDKVLVASLLAPGTDAPPIMGDFATSNVEIEVYDEWGTYIDALEGNLFDFRGAFYSAGTAP